MNYDLSFDRKTAILLAICTAAAAVLLVVSGFLLGVQHQGAINITSAVLAKMPYAPTAEKLQPPTPTASTLPATAPPATTPPLALSSDFSSTQPEPLPISISTSQSKNTEMRPVKGYNLQFGAFREEANAETVIKQLKEKSVNADIISRKDSAGNTWYTVRFGNYPTLSAASSAAVSLRAATQQSILIRPSDTL
jgi:cell division protein FtsN